MLDNQYSGVLLKDKWGNTYLCSNSLLAYSDLGQDYLWRVQDSVYGSYFLHDLEPHWDLRQIWAEMYQHARPWEHNLTKYTDFQLRDSLLSMFAEREMWIWQLTEGWSKPPTDNGIGDGGLAPVASSNSSAAPAGKANKPGGGATTEQPAAAKFAAHEAKSVGAPPKNPALEQRALELVAIGKDIRTNGYTPKTDAEIQNAIATGDIGDQRYLVSVQKRKSKDEPVGFRRPDTGRTTMWVSTFDMMKDKDLSAPLLMAALGSAYEPTSEYDLYILDQGAGHRVDGALGFVPTFENMQKFGPDELHKDDSTERIRDKQLLKSVMTDEQQKKYKENMKLFWSQSEDKGWSEYKAMDINEFAAENMSSQQERDEFRARHLYRTQIGNNAWFTGNGATEFNVNRSNAEYIESDGIKFNQAPGNLGTPELLTIQKNPPSIAQLEKQGNLKIIPIKGPGK